MITIRLFGVHSEDNDHKYLIKVFARERIAEEWIKTQPPSLMLEEIDFDVTELLGFLDPSTLSERPTRESAMLISVINATLDFVNKR